MLNISISIIIDAIEECKLLNLSRSKEVRTCYYLGKEKWYKAYLRQVFSRELCNGRSRNCFNSWIFILAKNIGTLTLNDVHNPVIVFVTRIAYVIVLF